jgi:hypothetical protein
LPPAPTVPSRLDTRPGRRGSPLGCFEAESEPGARSRSPGSSRSLRFVPVSPRAPRQGRSPGGSPLGRSGTGVPVPTGGEAGAEARFHLRQDFPRPKPRACRGSPWTCALGLPLRSSRAETRSCPTIRKAEALSSPVAARRLASRFPPDRRRTEVRPCLDREPEGPRPGHFTKPATLASAQGQARSFRMAAASSAARAFTPPPHRLVGQEAASLRLWLGRLSILRSIVSATGWKLSWNMIRTKRIPTVDNEDNGHK